MTPVASECANLRRFHASALAVMAISLERPVLVYWLLVGYSLLYADN